MKARSSVSCILLLILVISLLSTTVQATEYREVKAEEILKQIENDEDINLTYCRIVGELNVSKMKLETVPNPSYYKLLEEGYTKEDLISTGFKEKLSVFKSNITITNSSFENYINFSNVLFNNCADFSGATFNNRADFSGATFNNRADFYGVTFNNRANFSGAIFTNSADFSEVIFTNSVDFSEVIFTNSAFFYWATFNNRTNFSGAIFTNSAYFYCATFTNSIDFSKATFNHFAYFYRTTFTNSIDFSQVTFTNPADFSGATFTNSANFWAPETSKNIFTDGENCKFFMECYKDEARYLDADNIYYNYRKKAQDSKDFISLSKLSDFLSWITCGYGVRLSHTIYCIVGILLFFSFLYWRATKVVRLSGVEEKKSMLFRLEPILISIRGFTGMDSTDWYSNNDLFKILITVERLMGWIMLGIFMATLTNLMIRT